MATIPEITDRLEAATEKAENASQIIYDVANGDATTEVPTASGPTPTLKKWFQDLGSEVEPMLAGIPARLDKAFLGYQTKTEADSAALGLPNEQQVICPDSFGVISKYEVQSGALVFKEYLPDGIPFKTYSEISAYSGNAQVIQITSPGIAGTIYRDDSDSTSLANGGTIFIDSLNRRWKRPINGAIITSWFGVVGDGVANDTIALQSALSTASSLKIPIKGIGGKTYIINAPLIVNDCIDLDLCGDIIDGRLVPAGTTFNEVAILKVQGSIGDNVSVTADIPVSSKQITLSDTSDFQVSDYILLSSNQLMVDGYGNPGNLRGELNRVELVNNELIITTSGESLFSYSAASGAKAQKIIPAIGVKIRNGKILAGGVGSWHSGLQLHYCVDFLIDGIDVVGGEDVGISTFYCYGGFQRGGRISDSTNPDGGMSSDSGTGYGTCLYNATRDVIIEGVNYRNCKRAVTGGNRYPAVFNTTRNCVSEGGRNGFGTHEPCWWWTVADNIVRGMTGVGINVRGQFNKIHRNKLFDCAGFGIQVRTFYVNPLGIRGAELIDNYMERTAGILLDGDATDGRVIDVTVRGGEIRDATFNNVTLRRTDNAVITGVRMVGQQVPGSADGNCIVVSGSSTVGDNCTSVLITGNDMKDAARFGVRAVRAQKLQIIDNKVRQAQREAVNLDACSDSLVLGNVVKGAVVDFTYCIRATNCSSTVVNNNLIEGNGNTAQTGNHGIGFVASSGTCEDNTASGNTVRGCASAVIVTGTGVNHSVVIGNNGRNCYGTTKFNITSANQQVANNLI